MGSFEVRDDVAVDTPAHVDLLLTDRPLQMPVLLPSSHRLPVLSHVSEHAWPEWGDVVRHELLETHVLASLGDLVPNASHLLQVAEQVLLQGGLVQQVAYRCVEISRRVAELLVQTKDDA